MKPGLAACLIALLFPALAIAGGQQIDLKIGSVNIDPADMSSASCVQVPIFINDGFQNNRDLRDINFTVEITGDTGIINGGVSADMLVTNAFVASGGGLTGLTNPGTDLVDVNGNPSPSCALIFNQATQGSGPAINFEPEVNGNASWFSNNNGGGVGRKQGFLIDLVVNASIGAVAQNTDALIGVLEIPIIANPGTAQLSITATPNAVVASANAYTYEDGTSIARVQVIEDFDLSEAAGAVSIFGAPNCSGATTTPVNPTWLDPNAGGVGAELMFTFPGTATVDQVNLTSTDGLNVTIPAGGATTLLTIDTVNDGSPSAGANRSYTATYQVEFPPASGTFVGGTPCNLAPDFAPGVAAVTFDPATPVPGQPFSVDVTLTNAVWDGSKFGTFSRPGFSFDLIAPGSVVGNTLIFEDVNFVASASAVDIGNYTATGLAPDGTSFMDTATLGFTPPENQTDCAAISAANIEGSVTVPLQGNAGVTDWDVTYNGTTTNLPGGNVNFNVSNIVGNATDILIVANGFDGMGGPVSDPITCDIDYNPPTSVCTQDPDSTVTPVDVGTVITLSLDSTNGTGATVDGVPMTPDVNANTNFNVEWSATHVAVADVVLNGITTNPDGETSSCTWTIDVNDPTITVSPTAGLVTTEAGGSDTFTIAIDLAPSSDVTIGISSSDPTEGSADTAAVVFTPANWMTPQTVTVIGADDPSIDGDISYTIVTAAVISSDGNYDGLDSDDVDVINQDDDTANLSIDDVSVLEGTGAATTAIFSVTLDTAVDDGFSVAYATMDGSAVAPGDYASANGTLNFVGSAGEVQTISVSIVGDGDFEADESYSVVLSMLSNPQVTLTRAAGIGTIVNDDGADLSIVLSVVPQAGSVGEFYVINAVATNNGTGEATDVEINLEIPQGLSIVSTSPGAGGNCSVAPPAGGLVLVSCAYPGSTAVGATRSVEVLVQASAAGTSTVNATTTSALNDPIPDNNSASAVVSAAAQQIPTLSWPALLVLLLLVASFGVLRPRD